MAPDFSHRKASGSLAQAYHVIPVPRAKVKLWGMEEHRAGQAHTPQQCKTFHWLPGGGVVEKKMGGKNSFVVHADGI